MKIYDETHIYICVVLRDVSFFVVESELETDDAECLKMGEIDVWWR